MENQEVKMNDLQRRICEQHHLTVKPQGDGFVVTDRDPELIKKKVKLPRHRGTDLGELIRQARLEQDARRSGVTEPVIEAASEVEVVADEPAVEVVPEVEDESEVVADEPVIEVASEETNVVPLRRVALTQEEMEAPKVTLRNVILDNTGKKIKKIKPERKHRDNRLARAYRAIIENPEMTVAEQAVVADVTVAMLGYYEIQLRSIYKIMAEKTGAEVLPVLPALNK
jgi:hypothetical protein